MRAFSGDVQARWQARKDQTDADAVHRPRARTDVPNQQFLASTVRAVDGHNRPQRPGVPYKAFDTLTTFRPGSLVWEVEGSEADSAGQPRLRQSPQQALAMGVR